MAATTDFIHVLSPRHSAGDQSSFDPNAHFAPGAQIELLNLPVANPCKGGTSTLFRWVTQAVNLFEIKSITPIENSSREFGKEMGQNRRAAYDSRELRWGHWEYYDGTGDFSAEAMLLELHSESYRKAKKPIDVIWLWKQMEGTICMGRSGFVKLAIRILSMLPNSACPECAFSVFGITHTKHRNRLNPQKVHDATIVRMDRQKAHIAAGLIPERKSRRFSLADDEAEEEAATNAADAADYDVMAAALINLAQEESNGDDDEEGPLASAPLPSFPPPPTAAQSVPDGLGAARVPAYKKIKLADLFNYPAADSPAGLFVWQVGRDGLDAEEDALAAATNGDASDLTAEPAATQPGTVTPMQA
ncbi:hypothetical protein FB451DRAFT_1450004 [Mycena latifolia]|nr:hypothetical protein FB451DRAFT_1450004 [Mycena latifolia]